MQGSRLTENHGKNARSIACGYGRYLHDWMWDVCYSPTSIAAAAEADWKLNCGTNGKSSDSALDNSARYDGPLEDSRPGWVEDLPPVGDRGVPGHSDGFFCSGHGQQFH